MATYKVIQDIEAEDKLLGPLTLRQFIYAAIAAVCFYLCFLVITKHAAFLIAIFLPIALVFGFFAFPFGRDQPTEIWALAKVRFMLKPHKRIWNQSGAKELVTITAPKKSNEVFTNGLSRDEVQSRLKALALTIDTRGWVTKNSNVNLYTPPGQAAVISDSDRLVSATILPRTVPEVDVLASDDVLDEKNNRTAQSFDQMISESTQNHRKQVVDEVNKIASGKPPAGQERVDYWFLNQGQAPTHPLPSGYATFDTQVVSPGSGYYGGSQDSSAPESEAERELAAELKSRHDKSLEVYKNQHIKVIEPLSSKKKSKKAASELPLLPPPPPMPPPMPPPSDPAILALANNNDFNVATIARVANQQTNPEPPDDEVVIRLH